MTNLSFGCYSIEILYYQHLLTTVGFLGGHGLTGPLVILHAIKPIVPCELKDLIVLSVVWYLTHQSTLKVNKRAYDCLA